MIQNLTGLNDQEVLASRSKYGNNVLTPPPQRSLWSQFIEKFNDPLIKILLVALLLSMGLSLYQYFWLHSGTKALLEPLGILLAVVLATTVGFIVEVKANKKFELLNKSKDDLLVKVLRNGHVGQVPRRDVVVGDIVLLDAGERVPADGILLESVTLGVDESSLTGEPQTWKSHIVDAKEESHSTYPKNKLLRGSVVMEGNGIMQVERVGDSTEYGKVATEAQIDSDVATPLMKQLDHLGRLIARASYVIALFVVLGRVFVFAFDETPYTTVDTLQYFIETVMIAVTLIVVSVPEGLPMSITLSLALSMHRMLRTNNLVRRLHACETMGATTVICTDKTGTLTQNQMQVAQADFKSLESYGKTDVVTLNMACNSTAHLDETDPTHVKVIGNPTEGALLLWLRSKGIDYSQVRQSSDIEAQLPFSTERKYMATLLKSYDGKRLLLVKGAPEIIMKMCSSNDESLNNQLHACQLKAMRTLAFAAIPVDDNATIDIEDLLTASEPLDFLGYVAISDPVRQDVPAAIIDCRNAGVKVKIITGDNPDTAREIARQVGIWHEDDDNSRIITGPEFAAMKDDDAMKRVSALKIMARARPSDKSRLVDLLQRQGEVVAVTGDGTNDAPALKKAQVGLSMGDGTHVAREASDITILDNSFASINKAVLWGRSLYRNIQRFILFQLTVNVCACLVVGVGSFMCKQPPLSVTQMLWVNLIMDTFAALALASLPPNSIVMRVPPRGTSESIITRPMKHFIIGTGLLFAAFLIAAFVYILKNHLSGRGGSFISQEISTSELTIFFTTFVLLQFWNMFNAKSFASGHRALHNFSGSKVFFGVMLLILVGQVLIVQFGGPMFQVEPLPFTTWLILFVLTLPVFLVGEIYHFVMERKEKRV
ncbi:MAG: calcium-translocating P-type ATPase, PMCA-type [Muribaculaceae bacterium]|nr:calcium-translocating P-type ATPase, PMCA-type [Muribaculaceae bacterium]